MLNIYKYIKQFALIPSPHPDEAEIRDYIIKQLDRLDKDYIIDEIGNLYIVPNGSSEFLLSAHMDKQAEPNFINDNDYIEGKLDDAVGLGVILSLLESFEFHALITVGEESDSIGATYALENNLLPEANYCIVIDTSPNGLSEMGPVLYSGFLGRVPHEFISSIELTSKILNINLQCLPSGSNDGEIIIEKIPNTIALEPHIENYHTSKERAAKQDIIDIYKLIETLLKNE